jgi:hypothetical protein
MHKLVKAVLAAGACLVLAGCPKATSVTGLVTTGFGGPGNQTIRVGDTLSPAKTYYVDNGASITVTYDNQKTCTFRGPVDFLPGTDGSVCEKQDKDEKKEKDEKKDDDGRQDNNDQQQEQGRQDLDTNSGMRAPEGQPTTAPGHSGIDAPAATPTAAPGSSGIGGPQVTASTAPTYTRIMSVINNPILTTTLSVIGAAAVVKEVHDQTKGDDGDEPISK